MAFWVWWTTVICVGVARTGRNNKVQGAMKGRKITRNVF